MNTAEEYKPATWTDKGDRVVVLKFGDDFGRRGEVVYAKDGLRVVRFDCGRDGYFASCEVRRVGG